MTAPDEPVTRLPVAFEHPGGSAADWGRELLSRLARQPGYLLLTEAQQRGSPGMAAREVAAKERGHSRLPQEGGHTATWASALLVQGSAPGVWGVCVSVCVCRA